MDVPLLFRLKEAWLCSFVSEWLSITEIVTLDTAISCDEYRKHFHSCLQKLSPDISWNLHNSSLQWLSLRRVPLYTVVLNCDVSTIHTLANLSLPLLEILVVVFQEGNVRNEDQGIMYLKNSPKLQSIHLKDQNNGITNVGIQHISESCCRHTLTNFQLCVSQFGTTAISVGQLMDFFHRCSSLTTIGLTHGVLENYSGDDLLQLKPVGHLFDSLGLFNDPLSLNTSSHHMVELLEICPNLKQLDYASAGGSDDNVVLERLGGEVCPLLERFTFIKVSPDEQVAEEGISIDTYVDSFRRCSHLTEISLLGDVLNHFTDSDLYRLEEFGKKISSVVFESQRHDGQLSSYGLSSFLAHCPQLYSLSCKGIDKEDAATLKQLGVSCPHLHALSFLDMKDVTDDSFETFLHGCPKLRNIALSCESTLNIPTDAIFAHRFSPTLKEIDLRVNGVMWDETMVARCLAQCHELESFHVAWGRPVSDTVDLIDTHSLTDAGLAILTKGCPKLRKIKLYSSASLTINGLLTLAETCPLLSEITMEEIFVGDRPTHLCPHSELTTFRGKFHAITMRMVQRKVVENPGALPAGNNNLAPGNNNNPGVADPVLPAAGNMDVA